MPLLTTAASALPSPTTATVSASATSSAFGSPVILTAAVASALGTPDGTVVFVADSQTIGSATLDASGRASLTTSTLAVGPHAVSVIYLGSANFLPSAATAINLNIGLATCTVNVSASLGTVGLGGTVNLTATVTGNSGTPTGLVTFKTGASGLGNRTLDGSGRSTLSVTTSQLGALTIEADYAGDSHYLACISSIITINVTPGSSSIVITSSANPAAFGTVVTFTASVSGGATAPTGDVLFKDGTATIGSGVLNGSGQAVFAISTLSVGSHPITATYAGNASYAAGVSAVLQQAITQSPDSLRLRSLQLTATRVAAQTSGDAIAGTIEAAVDEGLSDGYNDFITPSALGLRMTSATGRDPGLPRPDWVVWADLRQTSLNPGFSASSGLSGSQVNSFGGVTLRVLNNFAVGGFGGYEVFTYDISSLNGRLRGEGVTAGAYLGWRFLPGLRFDAGVAQSEIGFRGAAGTAAGQFSGSRTLVTTGLAGNFKLTPALELEPSARFYALWESEAAYDDSLGVQQGSRSFSTGRTSAGAKLTYRLISVNNVVFAPYVGVYADSYFSKDSAAAVVPTTPVMEGVSGRLIGGVAVVTDYGARLTAGGEIGGIAGNFTAWSLRARGSLPF